MTDQTDGIAITEADKNKMNCKMDVGGPVIFDVTNLISSLLGFKKRNYLTGKNKGHRIIDIIGFHTISIHCNIISGIKEIGKDSDTLHIFNLTEPPVYMIVFTGKKFISNC